LFSFYSGSVFAKPDWEQRVVNITWRNVPLKHGLTQFAKAYRIGLFIDRRIDPDMPISFSMDNQNIKTILQKFAESANLSCYFFDALVYIGPREMHSVLPELLNKNRNLITQLPPAVRAKLQKKIALKIPLLSEPKIILKKIATQNQFSWQNLDELPHDIWDENSLPPMPLNELLTLILIGFNSSYDINPPNKNINNTTLKIKNITPQKSINNSN
jgi:hypothetical protein